MKQFLKILVLILLSTYLVVSFVLWSNKDNATICQNFYINVSDSTENDLIKAENLYTYLSKAHLLPQGKSRSEINTDEIEKYVRKIDLLDKVECYTDDAGNVHLDVSQRNPIMRVYTNMGETYYIDDKGEQLAVDTMFTDYVPIVSGCIDDTVSAEMLIPLVEYISSHEFWEKQITQIAVSTGHEVMLYPRVGNHIMVLGSIDNYKNKMTALMEVYKQIIPSVGWSAYDTISVKYQNQIVCTRRDKTYRHKTWTKKTLSSYE